MSGELHPMETRRRSRSNTPFLRSHCDHENCDYTGDGEHSHQHHHNKKTTAAKPNVQTIEEESVTVTSSSAPSKQSSKDSTKRSMASATAKATSSSSTSTVYTTSTKTTTVLKSSKGGGLSIASTSTPKGEAKNLLAESFGAQYGDSQLRAKEVTQNEMNTEFEKSQKRRSLLDFFSPARKTADQTADRSDFDTTSDHLAYLEYKRAGEYWKTTPKTDYTYSELSPHRRLLAPGVIAMPNMSRRSLENHHERVNYMVDRDPGREEYIRRRYEARDYAQNRKDTEKLFYDSSDEYDYTYSAQNGKRNQVEESWWLWRIVTSIVTTVTSIWTSEESRKQAAYNETLYYTQYGNQVERGFFGSIGHGVTSFFSAIFRSLYQFITTILCWETWALQSNVESRNKKRWIFFILLLLPLLLLGGLYYYLNPNEPFPPKAFTQFQFSLPPMPKVELSKYLNHEQYAYVKDQAYERYENVRDWADDYFAYLKMASRNFINEGRKLFRKEEYFERI